MAKTIKIVDLVERTNAFMKNSPDDARMDRIIIHSFVADLLLSAKAYSGFGYVRPYGEPGSDDSRTRFYA